jgi:hypothetical protein
LRQTVSELFSEHAEMRSAARRELASPPRQRIAAAEFRFFRYWRLPNYRHGISRRISTTLSEGKAKEDFHREMGGTMYGFEKLMSKIEPVVNTGN